MKRFFAGLDWAAQTHALCILDEDGAVHQRFEVAHSAAGLHELLGKLRGVARDAAPLAVAIERPSGLLVDTLMEAGFPVVPIHPNVVKATRPRYRSHGAKSDASDAYLLADLLRTDGARFAPLKPQSDAIRALRALVRGRDDLVDTRVQLANQLRSLLESFWPGAAVLFADIDSPIALAFVQRYPTPQSAAHLGEKRLAGFLAQQRYSDGAPPPNCSSVCVRPLVATAASWSWRPRGNSYARSPALWSRWSPRSPRSARASSTPSPNSPTGTSSCPCRAPDGCVRPRSSPSSAMCASATPPMISSPPRLASAQ